MKKIFAVSVLLVLFLLLGSAYATEGNETQTLKLDNEEHISVPNDESTFSQLKNEISSGGDINLSHSSYKFDSGTTIEITNPGTIDGKGAVIDMVGSWDVCVFKVYCDGVIIKNMTFKNAHSTYYGSAIYFNSSGTVVDCNFISNTADAAGAVFFENTGTIKRSNFTQNQASIGYGGAAYFYSSGIVEDCIFTDNKATSGGAIYFGEYGHVKNSTFDHNSAASQGGAINEYGYVLIEESNFTDNSAGMGGTVYSRNGGELSGCNFINNSATYDGGAVYFIEEATLNKCNFTENKASAGGVAYFYYMGKVNLCNFTANSATNGGAIYFRGEGIINLCNFTVNSATNGGAMYFEGNGNVNDCNLTANTATNGGAIYFNKFATMNNNYFTENEAKHYGGALYLVQSNTIEKSYFTSNKAQVGGAFYISADGTVKNSEFKNNTANYGAAFFLGYDSSILIEDTDDDIASSDSDSFHAVHATKKYEKSILGDDETTVEPVPEPSGTVEKCIFIENTAKKLGTVYFNMRCKVYDSYFTNNSASEKGGAIYFIADGNIENSEFKNNSARNGGAVYFDQSSWYVEVNKCIFTLNRAVNGGAIYTNAKTNIKNSNFTENIAKYASDAIYIFHGGGAIFAASSSNVNIEKCTFTSNTASGHGGAVSLYGTGTVTYSNFIGNSASGYGGAIYSENKFDIDNSLFEYNAAAIGSAIYLKSVDCTLSNSVLLNNRANSYMIIITKTGFNIEIEFQGNDNMINAIYSYNADALTCTNVTYWGEYGLMNTGNSPVKTQRSNLEKGQNISITVYDNDILILNTTKVTDANGKVALNVVAGNMTVTARHNDDSYYRSIEKTEKFETDGIQTVMKLEIDNDTANAKISTVSGDKISGHITFTVSNESGIITTESISISNNTAAMDLTKLDFGKYNITVLFNGNLNYYPSTANESYEKILLDSIMDINVSDITDSQKEIINITVNGKKDEKITVYVNTKEYLVTDGTLILEGLEEGIYNVVAYYDGNASYSKVSNSTQFKVIRDLAYYVEISNFTSTERSINITAKSNINNNLINGKLYFILPDSSKIEAQYTNGIWWVEKAFNGAGDYLIDAEFVGLDNVEIIKANVSIRNLSPFKITACDACYGQNLSVEITLPGKASGNITLYIGNESYIIQLNDSRPDVFNYTISNLPVGNYAIYAVYSGNVKYLSNTSADTFEIYKASSLIKIDLKDVYLVGEDILISLTPVNSTGTIVLSINGKNYVVVNNQVLIKGGLPYGEYNVNVKLNADSNHLESVNSTIFEVKKVNDYIFQANATDTVVGDKSVLNINLPNDAKGNLIINSKTYAINKTISLDLELTAGHKSVNVTYSGDDKYAAKSIIVNYAVDKGSSAINIGINDIYLVGDDILIILTAINSTGTVDLSINSTEYTVVNNQVLIKDGLKYGKYVINAKLNNDSNYYGSTNTAEFEVIKINDYIFEVIASDTVVGDNSVLNIILPHDARGNLTINGKIYAINKTITLNNELTAGNKYVNVKYSGDDKYTEKTLTATYTVNKANSSISIEVNNIYLVDDNIQITLTPTNSTGTINLTINGKKYTPTNNKVIIKGGLPQGEYTINAKLNADSNYHESTNTADFEVIKINDYIFEVIASDTVVGDNSVLNIILPHDARGNLTINGKIYAINKTITLNNELTAGNKYVNVKYSGDDKYAGKSLTANYFVNKAPSSITISLNGSYYVDDEIVIELSPVNSTGTVDLYINGEKYVVSDNQVIIKEGLIYGSYTVLAILNGDDNYLESSDIAVFNVYKITPEITAADIEILPGSDAIIKITSKDDITGIVNVKVNGKTYLFDVNDNIIISDLDSGNYSVMISYLGDERYSPANTTSNIYVKEGDLIRISTENVIKYYSWPERLHVIITNHSIGISGKSVSITINGITYNRTTNEEGIASIAVNLNSGNYTAIVNVEEYNFMKEVDVLILATIHAEDVVKVFRNKTQYYATFTDAEGNLLKNTTVSFNINGIFYERITNEHGVAKLNINLESGEYILTARNPKTGETKSNKIVVLSKIESSDLTKYYKNDSQFIVRVIDDYGNPAGSGENVTFNINGVFYTRSTNQTGHAKLNINLAPGKYIITSYYGDCAESNEIEVLPVLTADNMEMTYKDGSKFIAKLLDGKGRPLAGSNVTFNINGVFYNRITDVNGEAKLNINLMPGEYIITSIYGGAMISNTIKINK